MKRTPLYEEHLKLGARMVEFAGWEMPIHYPSGIIAEHLATRKCGGLFDVSHMGRFLIRGEDALPFLQHLMTNNAAALSIGQCQYTIIANESGGALDDAYLYQIGEREYMLVVNAANSEKDWRWLQKHKRRFPEMDLTDCTDVIGMMSLQGPRSKEVLGIMIGDLTKLPPPRKNSLVVAELFGEKVPISRTGYTGEPVGFELFPPVNIMVPLFQELLKKGKEAGIVAVGLGARDTLRLEACLPLYGHELGNDFEGNEIPVFALPVARLAVSFNGLKGDYIGREALWKQFKEVKTRLEGQLLEPDEGLLVPRMVFPLSVNDGSIVRPGYPVYINDISVGNVTSGTAVPYWITEGQGIEAVPGDEYGMRPVCLAYISASLKPGQKVTVKVRDKTAEAVITQRHIGSEAPPYARPIWAQEVEMPTVAKPEVDERTFAHLSRSLVERAVDNHIWRQEKAINLIPSEQTPSALVKLLTIADPSGRYAEHQLVKALGEAETYYYQGTGFISAVELELVKRMKEFLNCSEVETRLISGQMANEAVFSGLLDYLNRADRRTEPRRIKSVMNHHLGMGGHLSSQPLGALRHYVSLSPITEKWAVVNFPALPEYPYKIDLSKTAELIEEHKPELIILGKSMPLHPEPIKELSQITAAIKPKPIIMYDAAHVLGLLGPFFQEPFSQGADIVTASTHKTFFGTQRGIIASNMSEDSEYYDLWKSITRRAFPGKVSNHHLGTMLGLLMATYEMLIYGSDYQRQVIRNAKAFATALKEHGLKVEGDPSVGYTETHQVVLRVGYSKGVEIAERLEKNNIIVNFQALPDDEGFTASSGLRLGVQEMTRFGMKEPDFNELAEYMSAVIIRQKDVVEKITSFRRQFTRMQYCLPMERVRPLVNHLVESIIGGII